MKSAVNGGLQLSVLDGWWAEGYDGTNGWALSGDVDDDHGAQDHRDGLELYRLLDEEVAPQFYARDDDGLPREWLARVRASLRTNLPLFSAARMVHDYRDRLYGGDVVASVSGREPQGARLRRPLRPSGPPGHLAAVATPSLEQPARREGRALGERLELRPADRRVDRAEARPRAEAAVGARRRRAPGPTIAANVWMRWAMSSGCSM